RLDLGSDVFLIAGSRRPLPGDARRRVAPEDGRQLVGGQNQDVGRRSVVAPEAEGRDERQTPRAPGEGGGDLRPRHAAQRLAYQVRALEAERAQELVVGEREIEEIV